MVGRVLNGDATSRADGCVELRCALAGHRRLAGWRKLSSLSFKGKNVLNEMAISYL